MPASTEEVQQIVRLANTHHIPLVPLGAGLVLSGLSRPLKGGIVLDMKRMNRILEVNLISRYALVEAGTSQGMLRAYLDKKITPSKRFQEILFSCTACANCVEQCALPKIKDQLLPAFTAGKEELVNQGKILPSVRDCLTNLQKYGNPYGIAQKKRADWAVDVDAAPFSGQEYLFFVGDVGCFDNRGQEIARSVAKLLQYLGISFGILYANHVPPTRSVVVDFFDFLVFILILALTKSCNDHIHDKMINFT